MSIPNPMCLAAVIISMIVSVPFPVAAQTALLPDIFFAPEAMIDNQLDATTVPGSVLFRFDTAIPNVGLGELRLQATGVDSGDGRQTVNQVIQRDNSTSFQQDAGTFVWNPANSHMESPLWVAYRIRKVLTADGVGAILGTGSKDSVVIASSAVFDSSLPNFPGSPLTVFGGTHGISVGYMDLYPKFLSFQWVDVTGLPSDTYWLEVEVDVGDNVLESDETNNVTRIKVTLNFPDNDNDGLSDTFEDALGLNSSTSDSDGDGLTDGFEVGFDGDATGYNPFNPTTNPGGTDLDALSTDTDADGLSDAFEVAAGLNPLAPDSDGDGLDDAFENALGLDPTRADSDGDLLADGAEVGFDGVIAAYDPFDPDTNPTGTDTNALVPDSDRDGIIDGVEVILGTNPLNANSVPDVPVSGLLLALGIALASLGAIRLRDPR